MIVRWSGRRFTAAITSCDAGVEERLPHPGEDDAPEPAQLVEVVEEPLDVLRPRAAPLPGGGTRRVEEGRVVPAGDAVRVAGVDEVDVDRLGAGHGSPRVDPGQREVAPPHRASPAPADERAERRAGRRSRRPRARPPPARALRRWPPKRPRNASSSAATSSAAASRAGLEAPHEVERRAPLRERGERREDPLRSLEAFLERALQEPLLERHEEPQGVDRRDARPRPRAARDRPPRPTLSSPPFPPDRAPDPRRDRGDERLDQLEEALERHAERARRREEVVGDGGLGRGHLVRAAGRARGSRRRRRARGSAARGPAPSPPPAPARRRRGSARSPPRAPGAPPPLPPSRPPRRRTAAAARRSCSSATFSCGRKTAGTPACISSRTVL